MLKFVVTLKMGCAQPAAANPGTAAIGGLPVGLMTGANALFCLTAALTAGE